MAFCALLQKVMICEKCSTDISFPTHETYQCNDIKSATNKQTQRATLETFDPSDEDTRNGQSGSPTDL